MQSPLHILQQYWQHNSFRPMQEDIINAVLEGKDTLALLPTGGGKSICFQVPAMLMDGLCIVISPLIALMQDQVANLLNKGIPAAALHSGLTPPEVVNTLRDAADAQYRFLYVSPERLESQRFREWLPELPVSLIVVDEAHCISQWGYDFRPPYLRIAALREAVPDAPVIALTASATPAVQDDIIQKLQLNDPGIFRQSFERPNLSYSVFQVDSKVNKMLEVLNNVPGTGIVYCGTRRQTKELARTLQLHNISADYYHAGLTAEERAAKQEAWIAGTTRVMVCTNAFGMGIDKPEVRTVVHTDIPDCLENYYQEAGRAGRDGKRSYAVLLYQWSDRQQLDELPDKKFPPIPQIQHIYQCLADYLQIAVGNGEGLYYDFDLPEFVGRFKIDMIQVINTLKVLEQEGHISFSENIFLPSQVMITAERDALENVQESHPELDIVMKCLLRSYEGITENRVSVREKQVAKLCRITEEEVKKRLQQLQAFGILEYLPQKNTPQIHYVHNRASAKYLSIDHTRYLKRKALYKERLQKMIAYLEEPKECRSHFIAAYFGDGKVKDCGICDNCLAQLRKTNGREIDELAKAVLAVAKEQPTLDGVLTALRQYGRENVWAAVEYLLEERKLSVDELGVIRPTG